ncbi:CLUMA_CG006692, isoform A [Clunio marinus]|uniref:CLUMA_CG006692, isoform A n=1 Tax=Clunio marinus TaxID=568069 RepID=A0A1J1HY12_9DIPT|nr:CLUMA_CG006692, isoform A [Clunio marinus]
MKTPSDRHVHNWGWGDATDCELSSKTVSFCESFATLLLTDSWSFARFGLLVSCPISAEKRFLASCVTDAAELLSDSDTFFSRFT